MTWSLARAAVAGVALALAACHAAREVPSPAVGQWVWSARDAALLSATRAARPGLHAAVWIGTLLRSGARVVTQLGEPPTIDSGGAPTRVIRLDDSLHPLLDSLPTDSLAALVGPRLAALLAVAQGAQTNYSVQLDYDAPVRLLPHWAALLRALRRGALAGHSVWITSLLVHVEQPHYGRWFGGAADGHVLQLFDTQLEYSSTLQSRVEHAIAQAGLPCAIGLAAYEREGANGRLSQHRAWLPWAAKAARSGRITALWIFPAGTPYLPLLSSVGL